MQWAVRGPDEGACCMSPSSPGAVLLQGGTMTIPCFVSKVIRFGELGGLGNSNGGMAWKSKNKWVFLCMLLCTQNTCRAWLTLEGEPRMVGRGFRCISSLSLGDECRGRPVKSPAERGATGSDSCFRILCLLPPLAHSSRQGALWSREPRPAACGDCWGIGLDSVCCWEAGK